MARAQPGILAVWQDWAPGAEALVADWYNREHHAERVAVPGFSSAQRYVTVRARPRHFIFYETRSVRVLASAAYRGRLDNPTPLTRRAMPNFRNNVRACLAVAARAGSGRGGAVATLRFAPAEGRGDALEAWLCGDAFPDALAAQGIVSAELWRADAAVTGLASAERALRPGADVNVGWVVMLSANAPDQLRTVCRNVLPAPAWKRHGAAARPLLGIYRQVFSLGRDAN
ncbi:MAG TPA: hypothetical protein QF804_04980 [Rhodospirillales bacterium]|jgi:hypothetical protein|nr:hypothetical protein [Rhodospirillales bacterium]HJO69017.1 hypothetical protein [Rhodospirillales bacterium]